MIVNNLLSNLAENIRPVNVNLNYYTDSASLQKILDANLEKKASRTFAPPGTKKLVFFIDDLNMPYVDSYGTQSAIELLLQHLNYSHWYDRGQLFLKEVKNVQYIACMNPKAGSFTVNPRLQGNFSLFAVNMPSLDEMKSIYLHILGQFVPSR